MTASNDRSQAFSANDPSGLAILDRLNELALTAQAHSPQSLERRLALVEFNNLLSQNWQQILKFSRQRMRELELTEQDVLAELVLYVSQKIDRYNPNRAAGKVRAWLNFCIDKRVLSDGFRKKKKLYQSQDLNHLESIYQAQENKNKDSRRYSLLHNFIKKNSAEKFSATLQNRTDVNWQQILLYLLQGCTWEAISKELNITLPTLHSFHRRQLNKHKEYLQSQMSDIFEVYGLEDST